MTKFQSTLPTRGSDFFKQPLARTHNKFQSTLPTRGSDHCGLTKKHFVYVSIHAPHEGERRSQRGRTCR